MNNNKLTPDIEQLVLTICKGYYAGIEWDTEEQEDYERKGFKKGFRYALLHIQELYNRNNKEEDNI